MSRAAALTKSQNVADFIHRERLPTQYAEDAQTHVVGEGLEYFDKGSGHRGGPALMRIPIY
jgi:hypothetical protein